MELPDGKAWVAPQGFNMVQPAVGDTVDPNDLWHEIGSSIVTWSESNLQTEASNFVAFDW